MAVLGFLPMFTLCSAILSTSYCVQDFGNLLSDVSTASIKGAAWLAKYSSRKELVLDLAEVAHVGAFYKLLHGHDKIIDSAVKREICNSHKIELKNSKTEDLLWYTIGCPALHFCQNKTCPQNLAQTLLDRLRYFPEKGFNHPVGLSLAITTVSLYGIEVPWSHVQSLMRRVPLQDNTNVKDTQCYALLALSAVYKKTASNVRREELSNRLRSGLEIMKTSLSSRSPTNAMTVALLLQAKNAVEKALDVKPTDVAKDAISKLLRFQNSDGSFGNSLTTAASLLALSGHNILDTQPSFRKLLPNSISGKELVENESFVTCLAIHFKEDPQKNPPQLHIHVDSNATVYNVLQRASKIHPCYKFTHKTSNWGVYLTHLCGVGQDHIEKKYWMLYIGNEKAQKGISALKARRGHCARLVYQKVKFS